MFQHRFSRVEDYLHHRPPYLLVEKIDSITPEEIVTRKTVSADDYFISGHFPGSPIMPGAMMQELTTQSAGILIAAEYNPMQEYKTDDPFFNEYALGVLVKIQRARYKSFARPGDELTVRVKLKEHFGNMFDFSAAVSLNNKTIMRNQFQLANIKSAVLQGDKQPSAR